MPNKRKFAKLATKMLISGKLNSNKEVQSTMKYLEKKAEIDNEGINYDFENERNDFGKLDEHDDDTRKLKNSKASPKTSQKRKKKDSQNDDESEPKKIKQDTSLIESAKKNSNILPKKSQKNKYFFVAHPEALKNKKEIFANPESAKISKFIIDKEKIKLNEVKKLKKTKDISDKKKSTEKSSNKQVIGKKQVKKGNNKLWSIQECSDSSSAESNHEESSVKSKKFKQHNEKNAIHAFELNDIDKNFNIKKTLEKQADGTYIQVIKPEFQKNDDEDDESSMGDDENLDENEEESSSNIKKIVNNKKENRNEKQTNPMMEKLKASRFRYLNELLYTHSSAYSFDFFEKDKESFNAYHEGFKSQVEKWPINPLDQIIKYIKSKSSNLIVADFGCGEARLAQEVTNKVHSFDLVALNDMVIKCDMKNVPLNSNSIDIAVFCLSLMGINVVDFLCEAHRVLKNKGILKVAEVVSRIEDKNSFIKSVESIGFKIVSNNKDEKGDSDKQAKEYFYFFDFVKTTPDVKKKPDIKLAPCLYKKR